MTPIDNADAARRFARHIASDLSLYNEEKILEGLANDTLFEVLEDEIEEGAPCIKSESRPSCTPRTTTIARSSMCSCDPRGTFLPRSGEPQRLSARSASSAR